MKQPPEIESNWLLRHLKHPKIDSDSSTTAQHGSENLSLYPLRPYMATGRKRSQSCRQYSCYMGKIDPIGSYLYDSARPNYCNFFTEESKSTFGSRFLTLILLQRIGAIENRNLPKIPTYDETAFFISYHHTILGT